MSDILLKNAMEEKRGSVLYVTVLLVSVALAISVGVSAIAAKEIIFSSFGKDSQAAFFAADSGLECAMYHDFKRYAPQSAFPADDTETLNTVDCFRNNGGEVGSISVTSSGANYATTTMYIKFSSLNGDPCVKVEVGKYDRETTIMARGVNVSDKSASDCRSAINQVRRVERGLQVSY